MTWRLSDFTSIFLCSVTLNNCLRLNPVSPKIYLKNAQGQYAQFASFYLRYSNSKLLRTHQFEFQQIPGRTISFPGSISAWKGYVTIDMNFKCHIFPKYRSTSPMEQQRSDNESMCIKSLTEPKPTLKSGVSHHKTANQTKHIAAGRIPKLHHISFNVFFLHKLLDMYRTAGDCRPAKMPTINRINICLPFIF